MPIISGMTEALKLDLLTGQVHDFRTDVIKAALYTSVANLDPTNTTIYSPTNEATGVNWPAGGVVLPVRVGYPQIEPPTRYGVVAFQDVSVNSVTVTFRAILIYNSTRANRALMILDRGIDVVVSSGTVFLSSNPYRPNLIVLA